MDPITISLPGPPHGKGRPRFAPGGRVYTDQKTQAYEQALAWQAKKEMAGKTPFEGPISVSVGAFIAIPESWSEKKKQAAIRGEIKAVCVPDADNLIKSALDGLNGIVFKDDRQVIEVMAIKKFSVQPSLVVTVRSA
jgi:Holliday junction resolvase RusA-like endonuclease